MATCKSSGKQPSGKVRPLLGLLVSCLLLSCGAEEGSGPGAEGDTGRPAFDLHVQGQEGEDMVTCLFRFYREGREGPSQHLEPPGQVLLDGQALRADSASFTGAYYEAVRPAGDFSGSHQIVFTDEEGSRHSREFRFSPFALASGLPQVVKRRPFQLHFTNLPPGLTHMHLVLMDTSFTSREVNQRVRLSGNALPVTLGMLRQLKSGPVFLYVACEEERALTGEDGPAGKLVISYSLRREFELRD